MTEIETKITAKYEWLRSGNYPEAGGPDLAGLYRNPDGGWQCNYANWCAVTIRPGDAEPHEVHGGICARWYAEGGAFNEACQTGKLGYPISDEEPYAGDGDPNDRISHFERGDIIWTARTQETRVVNLRAIDRSVFVSYARKDFETVLPIVSEIERRTSVKPWIDLTGVESGSSFSDVIANAIKQCEVFVFMVTPACLESAWTRKEIGYARKKGRRICPLILNPKAELADWFEFEYSDVDCIDYTDELQREKFYRNLKGWLGPHFDRPAR